MNYSDVIIVGAGITGKSIAAILQHSEISCAIVDVAEKSCIEISDDQAIDPKVLALTLASKNILTFTQTWDAIERKRLGYFNTIHVWCDQGHGKIFFNSAEINEPVMGYIVEQKIIGQKLQEVLAKSQHLSWYQPAVANSLAVKKDTICLNLEDGRQLSAKLLIAADGQSSKIRDFSGINFTTHSYKQYALICVVETEHAHKNVAHQKFLNQGPLAFLPMYKENQYNVIWSTTLDHAKELSALKQADFNNALAAACDYHSGAIIYSGERKTLPLARAHTDEYCRPRLALVGDAAHRIHPLSGQGANLGLLDASCLSEIIVQAKQKNKDIGLFSVLRKYERWRKTENSTTMLATDILKYLFENKIIFSPLIRDIGINIFNTLPVSKHAIMKHAMGLAGELPNIARSHVNKLANS